MWKSEVEKFIKFLENFVVEVFSNGVLNYEQLYLYMDFIYVLWNFE